MLKYTQQDLLESIAKVESLHAGAEVLAKAFDILNDPDSNQNDLVEVVKTDTALTGDILKISNSAFYGGSMKIDSLEDAIHRLGFRELMKLISISMSKQMFNRELSHYGLLSEEFWTENAAVAATMENLSDLLDDDRSFYFTLGILHTIGRLVIDQTLEDRHGDIVWNGEGKSEDWEVENLGFDYTDSGHVLLTSWNFPHSILAVILNQLTPERVNNPPNSLMCLHYALRWCKAHKQFRASEAEILPVEPWMEELEVTERDLQDIYQKSRKSFDDLKQLAGM